ncbi:hypothetical protein ACFYRI_11065 [Streptomyces microflavus]|uniref:tetratricopeptide repeat protein n=1 Tax=Streptomyces microflavus TaxID=1919 RepID=UPI00367711CB
MAASASGENDPYLEATQALPRDQRNTGPETRARFEYQDECVALTLLEHFGGDLRGVLIEYSTDVILLPREGPAELVSIKHREPHRKGDPAWTWSALDKDRVLSDLYSAWKAAGKECTVAFHSNAGFGGPANALRQAKIHKDAPAKDSAVAQLHKRLKISLAEAEEFFECLNFPTHPLPRRNEITDVGVRRTADFLRAAGRSPIHAESCYEVLVGRIAEASTDRPLSRQARSSSIAATIRASVQLESLTSQRKKYLSTEEVRRLLLQNADKNEARTIPESRHPGWEPDPLFVGRAAYLAELERWLAPGSPDPASPVVISGMAGAGKTSLAGQFAALHSGNLRVEVIDGTTRAGLLLGLEELTGQKAITSISPGRAVTLPDNSATLVIIDGVTDPSTVRNLLPRQSLCRVLITTTASHIDESHHYINLPPWSSEEAHSFIVKVLPDALDVHVADLADHLGNHPLAVNQAVNYCSTVGLTIPQYLDRFRKASAQMLDRGEAGGHPVTVASAIQLALAEAEVRNPLSRRLLTLLAHIGAEPLRLDVFDIEPVRPFVVGPVVASKEERRFLRKRTRTEISWAGWTQDDEGWNTRVSLFDEMQRDDAIACLSAFSLVSVERGTLRVHPLIRLFAAETSQGSETWIETAFGLFASQLVERGGESPELLDPHIAHVIGIVDEAFQAQMHGPAVMAVAKSLVNRLCALGDQENAVRIGDQVLRVAEDLFHQDLAPLSLLFAARESLGQAHIQSGDADRGLSLIETNVELTELHADQDSIDRAYMTLGSAAVRLGRRDIADSAIRKLPNLPSLVDSSEENPVGSLLAAHVRFRLLELTNRLEEAEEVNAWCISRLNHLTDSLPVDLITAIHSDAAMLARLQGSVDWQAEYLDRVSEAQAAGDPSRRDRFYFDVQIGAADAAIERGDSGRAIQILESLDPLLSSQFGVQSSMYASFLAARGRCRLHQAAVGEMRIQDAEVDLLAAVKLLRATVGPERAQLASALINLSSTFSLEGRWKEALSVAKEAYEEDLRRFGPDHPETQFDLHFLNVIAMQFDVAQRFHLGDESSGD